MAEKQGECGKGANGLSPFWVGAEGGEMVGVREGLAFHKGVAELVGGLKGKRWGGPGEKWKEFAALAAAAPAVLLVPCLANKAD